MKQSATKPKGATSYKETALGIIPRSKLLTLELDGTKRGLEYIQTHIDQINQITPDLICKLHEISFAWIFPAWTGTYRKIQVTYSGKEAPLFHQIPELITNFCRDIEEQLRNLPLHDDAKYITEAVSLLAWMQHAFVFIHPFQDYNGRIARMLTICLLLKLNLPPVEIQAENETDRKKYIKAMQEADKGNLSLLETLISQALIESLEHISK